MRWLQSLRNLRATPQSVYASRGLLAIDGLGSTQGNWMAAPSATPAAPEMACPLPHMAGPARPSAPLANLRQYAKYVEQEPGADEQQEEWFGHVKPLWKGM